VQKARPRPAPPPPPEPSLLDNVLSQPLYLVAGVLIAGLIGLLAVRTVRRRREAKSKSDEVAPAFSVAGAAGASRTLGPTETDVGLATRNRDIAEEVDPLEEAEIFLAYGRDTQAEELLREAISANPRRYEIHVKLLEIYARRKDAKSFEQLAREVQQGTGGRGEMWDRVVALGYQVDPQNPRYAAGRGAAEPGMEDTSEQSAAERLDFEVGLGDETESSTSTDIDLGDTARFERTQILSRDELGVGEATEPAAASVDLNIDLPAAGPGGAAEPAAPSSNAIDFDFDIGKLSAGEPAPAPAPASAPASSAADSGLDFDVGSFSMDTGEARPSPAAATPSIDLSAISLDLGATTSPSASSMGKDEKWYEVQTKFDLAKAYQEMGDKDGAREILKEVIAEGDAEQKAAAQAVLASLE
jgi:pilus assembly protein FimV